MTEENQQENQQQEEKPFNYRQLEESRDKYREREEKWRRQALRGVAKDVGLDPEKGTGKLALEAFERTVDDLDPDEDVGQQFTSFLEDYGVEVGEGGSTEQTSAEQLIKQQQGKAQDLQGLGRPPQASGTLQQQIAAAEAEGDKETVDALNAKWVAQMLNG